MGLSDPVTGFHYPDAWIDACNDPALLADVGAGLAVLTSSGTVLRRGYTTGTTAAAACKASVCSLAGEVDVVEILIPAGFRVCVPAEGRAGSGIAKKYPGSYPGDVTAGLEFRAEARPLGNDIVLIPGEGIGRYTRTTRRFSEGEPAISPPALACILSSIQEGLDMSGFPGVEVRLSVPGGEGVASLTLNPKMGVGGGISILGTTGLVEPWDDHLETSVMERVAAAHGPVLTTGRLGLRYARMLFPEREVILVGSRIGQALEVLKGPAILCGLPALVLRYLTPRLLEGTNYRTVEELAGDPVFLSRMDAAFEQARSLHPGLRVVLVDRDGNILGDSG
ncbi:cobalt-precorrin-5B (C1)-methyltransferase [Methanolinea mesophila]|uniref:cobalt-precorrin-5B (C(1))-methyltransferase n=1 Tax=Methanolinea mesophila TaxID=547055 RepID=UPI001AE8E702|nr:cobalt-precorrin-5B (C(1))-methyltransferase [Methanolinea mesophila]MBP1929604.1 cobalt-precorrin-5B (C1)-methyltransferase [Methanolinea mesophila]